MKISNSRDFLIRNSVCPFLNKVLDINELEASFICGFHGFDTVLVLVTDLISSIDQSYRKKKKNEKNLESRSDDTYFLENGIEETVLEYDTVFALVTSFH